MSAQPAEPAGPYGAAALAYRRAGWTGVLPLPPGTKWPPPDGYTGNDGVMPSGPDIVTWTEGEPISYKGRDGTRATYRSDTGNVALRLPQHIVGIDVDDYDGKNGGATLAGLEATLGPLPATWRTTSRDDGVSGIRLYRIRPGYAWPNGLGAGIEIVRHAHRYAVAWPSVHPDTGGTYRWITPDGLTTIGDVPQVEALPNLPEAWLQHATKGREAADVQRAGLDDTAAGAWLGQHGAGQPCRAMYAALERYAADLHLKVAARHDVALAGTARIAHLAAEGHPGGAAATAALHAAFLTATAGERRDPAEWPRLVTGAVDIAAASTPAKPGWDPCTDPFFGLIAPGTPVAASQPPAAAPAPATVPAGPTAQTAPPSAPAAPAEPFDITSSAPLPPPTAEEAADALTSGVQHELLRQRAQRIARDLLDAERSAELLNGGPAYRRLVDDEVGRQRVRDGARRILAADGEALRPPPRALDAFLLEPDPPVTYRIDGLWPAGGRVMLTAAFKAGKSTLVGNVIRCLVDGGDLLDRWPVVPLGGPDSDRPDGRIILIDDELDTNTLRRWLRDQGIVNAGRVSVIPLRGAVSSFNILDQHVRSTWARMIRDLNGAVVILDCLRPVLDAVGLDEHSDAGRFLTAFDDMLGEACAQEAIVVHHAGHEGERARGDSRLRDWPDVEWRLVREKNADSGDSIDPSARRYFAAYGRDVDVPEGALAYDQGSRRLSYEGGSRTDAKASSAIPQVIDALRENPEGLSERGVIEWVSNAGGASRRDIKAGIREAYKRRLITITEGARGAKVHRLAHAVPVVSDPFTTGLNDLTAPVRRTAPPVRRSGPDDCASAPIGAHGAVDGGEDRSDCSTGEVETKAPRPVTDWTKFREQDGVMIHTETGEVIGRVL